MIDFGVQLDELRQALLKPGADASALAAEAAALAAKLQSQGMMEAAAEVEAASKAMRKAGMASSKLNAGDATPARSFNPILQIKLN